MSQRLARMVQPLPKEFGNDVFQRFSFFDCPELYLLDEIGWQFHGYLHVPDCLFPSLLSKSGQHAPFRGGCLHLLW